MDPISIREEKVHTVREQPPAGTVDTDKPEHAKKAARAGAETAPSDSTDVLQDSADSIARDIERYLQNNQTDLRVEIDRASNTAIFKIIRKEDGKVLKEIPPRELIEFASKMKFMVGAMLDSTV